MWGKSKPGDYTSFRTFIFGITSQSMFPNGVIYEGVSDEPLSFRGESGANDSMVCVSPSFPSLYPSLVTQLKYCHSNYFLLLKYSLSLELFIVTQNSCRLPHLSSTNPHLHLLAPHPSLELTRLPRLDPTLR